MKVDSLRIFSTIKPVFMRAALMKGSLTAGSGVLLLAYCGTFIPADTLQVWGIPILLVGGLLITAGLLPYRKLCSMESNPSELVVVDGEFVQYIAGGKQVYSIPIESIDRYNYVDTDKEYGIAIHLHKEILKKIIIHNRKFNMELHQRDSQQKYGCDVFVPYFSRRAFTRITLLD